MKTQTIQESQDNNKIIAEMLKLEIEEALKNKKDNVLTSICETLNIEVIQ